MSRYISIIICLQTRCYSLSSYMQGDVFKKCAREVFGQTYTYRQHNDNAFENNRSNAIFFKCFYIYRVTI